MIVDVIRLVKTLNNGVTLKPKHTDFGSVGLVTKLIRWLSPIDDATKSRLTEERWNSVRAEFSVHQGIAEGLCLAGLIGWIFTAASVFRPIQPWDIGIAFGLMVTCPLCCIFAICFLKTFSSAYQRWADYSTMKYAIPWSTQLWWLYAPTAAIGAISAIGRLAFPIHLN